MSLDAPPQPGQALLAHVRRRPFVYLSLALHAALLGALYYVGSYRVDLARQRVELDREQRSIDYGKQLTERARLEKRVHDMARIKSLLEQSAGAPADDEVQFSAHPRTPARLLEDARTLSRDIDRIARDTRAEHLARLLNIPKDKALEKLAQPSRPAALPPPAPVQTAPTNAAQAAAQIEQLEAKARTVLEQRRQQLQRQQDGTPVAPSAARSGKGSGGGQGKDAGQGQGQGQGHGNTGGASLSSVLNRMVAFANPDLPDRTTQAYTTWGMHDFFDHGVGRIPDVDAGKAAKGAGRIIGPGGAHADRIFVNAWYLIGPFAGKHGEGLFSNHRYPPEQGVVLDAVYRGKDGRLLRWEYVDSASYPLIPAAAAEDAVYYGYTELMLDQARDLAIWVGADDDAQLWLNDSLVWQGGNVGKEWFFGQVYDTWNTHVRDYNLSEGKRAVHFRKGRNKLFFKLSNGPTRLFFSLVLTR